MSICTSSIRDIFGCDNDQSQSHSYYHPFPAQHQVEIDHSTPSHVVLSTVQRSEEKSQSTLLCLLSNTVEHALSNGASCARR